MQTFAIVRKPLHPMLVALPIGLWLFSFFCDIVHGTGWGGAVWNRLALYTLAAGIVMGIIAVIAGLLDYLSLDDHRFRKLARKYLTFHLIALVLYVMNFAARRGNAEATVLPVMLSFVGVVLVIISGWLGADLIHEYRVRGDYRDAGSGI